MVEVDARRVLIKPRRDLMLGFLDGHAVDVVDLLADLHNRQNDRRAAGQHIVVGAGCRSAGSRHPEDSGSSAVGSRGTCSPDAAALSSRFRTITQRTYSSTWVPSDFEADRAHEHDAGLAVGIFLQPDHFGDGAERVAGIDRREKAAIGITEIGDRIQRDIRHGLAEHDMEHQQVVDRRARIADRFRKGIRRLNREARAEQPVIDRDIAGRDGARRGMADGLADPEILEKIS